MTASSTRDLKFVSIVTTIIVLLSVVVFALAYQVIHITSTSNDLVDTSSLFLKIEATEKLL
jgi:adenylosuccinate lyase